MSDRQLRKIIDDLRELERKCFAARSRFAFYDYLAAVFELYVQLRRTKQAKQSLKALPTYSGFTSQTAPTPSGPSSTLPRPQTSRPAADGAGPCGTPGANAGHGKTLGRSCVKMAGLRDVQISLLQSTQGEGIRVASSTAAS